MPIPINIKDNTSIIKIKTSSNQDNIHTSSGCAGNVKRLEYLINSEKEDRIEADEKLQKEIDELKEEGLSFTISTNAESTPLGIIWDNEGVEVEGTLEATSDLKQFIYLVPHKKDATTHEIDYYREYAVVNFGTEESPSYNWEYIGNTDIDLSDFGDLAWKDSASVTATATYTPQGTISTPTITVTPSTTSISVKDSDGSVTSGSAASFTEGTFSAGTTPVIVSVASETLTFQNGTAPSKAADTFVTNTPTSVTLPTFTTETVVTGIASAESTEPTFSGTEETITSTGTAE